MEQCAQIRRPATVVDGFRPSGRVHARRGAAYLSAPSASGSLDRAEGFGSTSCAAVGRTRLQVAVQNFLLLNIRLEDRRCTVRVSLARKLTRFLA
jgi:hypothetical protein